MIYLVPTFKLVSIIFALASLATGIQAILTPLSFAKSFGILIPTPSQTPTPTPVKSYISLLGIRQLATGLIILTFGYQGKWEEVATILVIIGLVVAWTDGVFLAKAGNWGGATFHAIPGAGISLLAYSALRRGM
jgi:hypothetical protein